MADSDVSGKDEPFLKRVNKFAKKWTGGDYYERSKKNVQKKFREQAPKTAEAVEKATDFLARGAAYSEIPGGGPLLGMARKSPRAASDLVKKKGSLRSKFAEGPAPRPAADVKPGSARAAAAKGPQPKIQGSGTFSDKLGKARTESQGAKVSPGRYKSLEVKDNKVRTFESNRKPNVGRNRAVAAAAVGGAGIAAYRASQKKQDASPEKSYQSMTNPTQRAYDKSKSPIVASKPTGGIGSYKPEAKPPVPKLKPAKVAPAKKSKTRIAFEKEFAAARKRGDKSFKFKGGKYSTYNTKLAK